MTVSQIFSEVLNMSMTASLIILIVMAVRLLLRKAPKKYAYLLWAVVLFRLLCPVSISSPVSALGFLETEADRSMGLTTRITYTDISAEALPQPAPSAPLPPDGQPGQPEARREPVSFAAILPWVWLAGVMGMQLYGIVTYLCFRARLTVTIRLGPNIYLADHIRSAFVAGVIRPKIYLPSSLSEKEMAYILAHEKYHLKRCDHLVKHLAFFALSLHWFNPLVWAAFLLSGKDMEMSCDEAVLLKLGGGIRKDYAASLLALATGRRIIDASPLAFGEGDTKSRVINLSRWKKPKAWVRILSFALCAAILAACAANPAADPKKETGEASIPVTAPTEPAETAPQEFLEFSSTDGAVVYRMAAGADLPTDAAASVSVAPRKLGSEDFERIARVLAGDADFYEREPTVGAQYSKGQYQRMLDLLEPYTGIDAMTELVGTEYALDQTVNLKDTISRIQEAMKTAPEENPLTPCDWKLKKERTYNNGEWEYSGRPLSEDNDWLVATSEVNGMGCTYMAVVSEEGSYKLNRCLFQLGGASLDTDTSRRIYWKALCRTGEPTEEQIQAAQEKGLNLLGQMVPGRWQVSNVEVQTSWSGSQREYCLNVHAVPLLNGIPAVYDQQALPQNWEAAESEVTGSYVPTNADFLLSANGDVLDMELDTPFDILSSSEEKALPFSQLMDIAKDLLSNGSSGMFGMSPEQIAVREDAYKEKILCHVSVSQIELAMVRDMEENPDGSYTYRPTLIFSGNAEYRGETSGTIYESNTAYGPVTLFCINAMDGTVIY